MLDETQMKPELGLDSECVAILQRFKLALMFSGNPLITESDCILL